MPRQTLASRFFLTLSIILLGYVASLWLARDSTAIESFQLSLETILGEQLRLEGIQTQVNFTPTGKLQLTLTAASVGLPGIAHAMTEVSLVCKDFQPLPALVCRSGSLSLTSPEQQRLQVPINIHYQINDQKLLIELGKLKDYWDRLSLTWHAKTGQRINVIGQSVTYTIYALVKQFITLPELAITAGKTNVDMTLSLLDGEIDEVSLIGVLRDYAFSNTETTQAVEGLTGNMDLQAKHADGVWQGRFSLDLDAGFVYIDPVGIDVTSNPLQLSSEFRWASNGDIALSDLSWQQPDVARLSAAAQFSLQEAFNLHSLDVSVKKLALSKVYPIYVQPWLYEFDLPDLEFNGSLAGELQWLPENIRLAMQLNQVAVQDSAGQFGMGGLNGELNWNNGAGQQISSLAWQRANFYQLPFGAARITFSSSQNEIRLVKPVTIPLLDGAINIDDGFLRNPGAEDMAWSLNAYLQPVSMFQLTEALGWQTFGGKLSGMIPELRYQDRQLQLDGTLLISAFDGNITVRDLLIKEPFGLVPRLQADVLLDNLDLEAVTGTFSFGKIEGRLDGYVNELEMLAWQPVRFDALLITPPDDKSRHRISQRAVDNLTKIGGGVGGALSRSFLRFFEEFSYDKLGLGCRLENGVCQMRGAQAADQGYYIVKGGFMPPRIDIVGYADQVDWRQLVNQLIEVTRSGEVTVE